MRKRFLILTRKFRSLYTGKYALITNTVTAGTMGCIADTIAQGVERKVFSNADTSWDFARSRNMTVISTAFGPLVYYWYRFLDTKFPGKTLRVLVRKVGLDLAIAPIWYGFFIGGLCLLKNSSLESSLSEYKDKAPILIGVDLMIWPVLQSFNFYFFPPYYRIIGMKLNEMLMGIFTSHLVNNEYSAKEVIATIASRNDDDEGDNKDFVEETQ